MAAAGSGERLGAGGPKAFVPLAGKPMIEWSIDAFRACDSVHSIVVAAPPGHVHDLAGHDLGVVSGGATRARSVANAMEAVGTALVAIHDAARPLLTPELVEALVASLDDSPEAAGVIAATAVTDTIKEAGEGTRPALGTHAVPNAGLVVSRTVDRSRLWAAQTPQVFRTDALREALGGSPEKLDEATDEAMMIEMAGGAVLIHSTGPENLKVTTPLDLRVAEMLLAERSAGPR
ncbi:MAG: 2-C-methyl-D-erythritol 4-phosphate cytidylyltransferase [Solirubrobacterales bacterium]